jgi:hypothetical protein
MLTKLATFRGVSPSGEPLVQLFEPGTPLVKEAGTLMPEIRQWRANYKTQSDTIAVLVNALGASEYWGQNVNGDIFPEAALIHDCRQHKDTAHPYDDFTGKIIPVYGYSTFLDAFPFVHHRNKDPSRAFGHVALAVWNPRMHRVELVVLIDKALAMQHGAQDVVDRIMAGEYPDVSMGCRVPYDVCAICGNKSKTRNDYCACVKEIGMGKILDDGRRVGVYNYHPRFFDISFVFIGADKTAKVMCKLASGFWVPMSVADADYLYGEFNETGLTKAASVHEAIGFSKEAKKSKPWYKSELAQGGLAGAIGGLGSAALFTLLDMKKSKIPLKALASKAFRAAGEGGAAGAFGAGAVTALNKLPESKSPKPKALKMAKTAEAVKESGLKDLSSVKHLFENLIGKHTKTRLGRRSIRIDKLLKKTGAEQPDPTDEADTRLLMGRVDNQESPTAVGDGTVHTNIFHNEGEDSAGVDRGSGFTPAPPTPNTPLSQRRPKIPLTTAQSHRMQWSGDVGGDSANLSKEAFDIWRATQRMTERRTGLKATFERAKLIKVGPPPTPNRKEFPFVGTIEFRGLTVHVENKPGDTRVGRNGNWRTLMHLPYGEILGTRGVDGDKLDVYVGPWRDAENAYIVHQNFVGGPKDGKYDEDKVMLGFDSAEQAKAAYLAHYNNPKYFRSITAMAFPLFKRAILHKEAQGEKLASIWASSVANFVMEDEFGGELSKEASGEMEKSAAALEDLFSCGATARRRERTWRNKVTGEETNVTGSGMASSDKAKTAAPKCQFCEQPASRQYGAGDTWVYSCDPHCENGLEVAAQRLGRESSDPFVQGKALSKTASVSLELAKVAHVLHYGWSLSDLLKVSNETKAAAHLKWADIVKRIGPSKAVGRATPLLSQNEPDLPVEVLNKLGEDKDLKKSLTTPALMGMVLKPREFQRIVLVHIGKPDVADKMDADGEVFKPSDKSSAPCEALDPSNLDEHILQALLPFLEGKSYTGPVVRRRIVRIIAMKPSSHPEPREVDSPLLSKVASAYTWYRKEIMKLARALPATVTSHPELHARTLGIGTEDLFSKTAMGDLGLDRRSVALLLGTVPLSLLYSAHKRGEMERGEDTGPLGALIAEHPWLTSMGVVTGLGALLRDPRVQQALDEAFDAGGRIWRGKQAPVGA